MEETSLLLFALNFFLSITLIATFSPFFLLTPKCTVAKFPLFVSVFEELQIIKKEQTFQAHPLHHTPYILAHPFRIISKSYEIEEEKRREEMEEEERRRFKEKEKREKKRRDLKKKKKR